MLGIGSGSTIVHAVQRIGVSLGWLSTACSVGGGARVKRGRRWGTGWAAILLGSSSVECGRGAACLKSVEYTCSSLRGMLGPLQPPLEVALALFTLLSCGGWEE